MKSKMKFLFLLHLAGMSLIFQNCADFNANKYASTTHQSIESQADPFIQTASNSIRPHFKSIWLEPHSINLGVVPRDRVPDEEDIQQLMANYHAMGIRRVVIAYSEYLKYYFYQPSTAMQSNYPAATSVHRLSDGSLLLPTLLKAADEHDLEVIVGLSPFGNKFFIHNLTQDLKAARMRMESDPSKIFSTSHINELNRQILLNKMMIDDIFFQFGHHKSLSGFFIVQEPHCLDTAMNFLAPVARHIKSKNSKLKVMISPNADAEVCFNQVASNSLELMQNYRNHLNTMKAAGVDIIAYQDSIGAGYQAGINQFVSYSGQLLSTYKNYALPGDGFYHYNELARQMRLNYLKYIVFPGLKLSHQFTGVEFWINTELWRMDGRCGGGQLVYGCNFPGNDFTSQLTSWSELTSELMLNEGFTQFDFTNAPFSLINQGILSGKPAQENAKEFTRRYLEHLKLHL